MRSALLRLFDGTRPIPADRHTLFREATRQIIALQVERCARQRLLTSEHVAQVERSSPSREMDDRCQRLPLLPAPPKVLAICFLAKDRSRNRRPRRTDLPG